ncbi:hypothetical protein HYW75_06380 [Candidatus Pacearchaeota archaeon]|nr:hypothetical protein [Candidatus Pacearchaeota archaeon]
MFWDKKEEKKALPDLPPLQSPFNKNFSPPLEKDEQNEPDEELETEDKHPLPSFPDSPLNKGFSQAAIKDAVGSTNLKDDLETAGTALPTGKEFKTVEMEETKAITPSITSMQKSIEDEISHQSEGKENFNIQVQDIKTSLPLAPPPIRPIQSIPQVPKIRPLSQPTQQFSLPIPHFSKPASRNQDIFVKIEKFQAAKRSLQTTHEHLEQIDSILKKIRETKLKEEQELTTWEKDLSLAKSRIQEITENIFEKLE